MNLGSFESGGGGEINMRPIKVVLFDLDDTLVHFEDYWNPSLLETFRRHPATRMLDPDRLLEVWWEKNAIYERQYHDQLITIRQFRNFRLIEALAEFGVAIDETVAEEFNDLHKTISKSYMKADPKLVELLKELKQSYSLGLVTNGTAAWQYDKLDAMGIRSWFEPGGIFISEEVGVEKPHPGIFLKALEHFRAAPEETVFVGDSWKHDIEGATRVGIRSIWLNKRHEPAGHNDMLMGEIFDIFELRNVLGLAKCESR